MQWNQESATGSYAPLHESLGHIQAQTSERHNRAQVSDLSGGDSESENATRLAQAAHDISNNPGVLVNAIADLQPGHVDQLRVVVIVLMVGDSV